MNRDMDIVRQIVLALRAANEPLSSIDGIPDDVFKFNADLVVDGKLAEGTVTHLNNSVVPAVAVLWRLTWLGHDFADAASDSKLWAKAKTNVIAPAGGVAFSVLLEWLKAEVKRQLGLPP